MLPFLAERLTPWLAMYKNNLPQWTQAELYKWRATQTFQNNWDATANDFPRMLKKSLATTENLLTSVQYFARLMIERFADQYPEEVRVAFVRLFDEAVPLPDRIEHFKADAESWRIRFAGAPANSSYQDERAIMVYLSLRYPEQYYLFKPMMYQNFAQLVGAPINRRQRAKTERLLDYLTLAEEVRNVVAADKGLVAAHQGLLGADCYPDESLHLLTQNVIYKVEQASSVPKVASDLDIELNDDISTDDEGKMEDEAPNETIRWWAIGAGEGGYMWDEWQLEGIVSIGWDDLSDLRSYDTKEAIRQELLEDTENGSTRTNDALACWQFCREIRPGDYIVAKQGRGRILGVGHVTGSYQHDPERAEFHHVRSVQWLLAGQWDRAPDTWLPTKTLTEITNYESFLDPVLLELDKPTQLQGVNGFSGLRSGDISGQDRKTEQWPDLRPYTLEDAADELFMPEGALQGLLHSLKSKKNIILQGPPGVGKSFVARRLAYLLLGVEDTSRVQMVQFHPSYSYEDFIMGYRPTEQGGFTPQEGVFLKFVGEALRNPEKDYVFIIDELNRANLGKVLGECMLLLESSKRGPEHKVRLPYGNAYMYLPEKLHVIGTMNTADRSLALVDFALRRRFAFKRLQPELGSRFAAFLTEKLGVKGEFVTKLTSAVNRANAKILADRTLGQDFLIGHSYFSEGPRDAEAPEAWYERVLEDELDPQLEEYWIENPAEAKGAQQLLRLTATAETVDDDE